MKTARKLFSFFFTMLALNFILACCHSSAASASEGTVSHAKKLALENKVSSAVAYLSAETHSGGKVMLCSVTATEKYGHLYVFVSAAHCVAEDDVANGVVGVAETDFYINFDDDPPNNQQYYFAKIMGVGYQTRGDDFAIFLVNIPDRNVPAIPVATSDPRRGEEVFNFAFPFGLSKQLFTGRVSAEKLNRPIVTESFNWTGTAMVQISAGPGSSGSSIVSYERGEIVCFLVGVIQSRGSSPMVITMPAARYQSFKRGILTGTYKWYDPTRSVAGETVKRPTVNQLYKRIWGKDIAPEFVPAGTFNDVIPSAK